jgi:hypothetical protein
MNAAIVSAKQSNDLHRLLGPIILGVVGQKKATQSSLDYLGLVGAPRHQALHRTLVAPAKASQLFY